MDERPGRQVAVSVRVSGRVQGVGYRAWTQRRATALGLAGWVRNLPDGSVLALVCGPAETVAAMLDAMRDGPAGAVVDRVDASAIETAARPDFVILR